MATANVIGKGYEYRVKKWFIAHNWKSERNPLSGASQQISSELGKHDVRSWREDLRIFLQIECKKTNKKANTINVKQDWFDKIDFGNDEFLCFSYKNCLEHFCLMPTNVIDKIMPNLNKTKEIYSPVGKKQFIMKREWLEKKPNQAFVLMFNNKEYSIVNLEEFINAREKSGETKDFDTLKNKSNQLGKYEKIVVEIEQWIFNKFNTKYDFTDLKEKIKNIFIG